MMSLRVTPLVEEEGANVDGAEGVEGATNPNCLHRNYASLRLTVAASIAPITEKWLDKEKGTEKWHKIHVIVERKMSLSRVAESLYIYDRKNEMRRKIYTKMLKKGKQKPSMRLCDRFIVR